MPVPRTPSSVDDIRLGNEASRDLGKVLAVIWGADPTRPAENIVAHALRTFRLMYSVVLGAWVKRAFVSLGGEEQGGVVIRFPSD